MKKFLFVLLFSSLVSFGQSYKDVMSIKSIDTFKKVAIENGYEFSELSDDWVSYGFNIDRDSIKGDLSTRWMWYNVKDYRFTLRLSRTSTGLFGAKSIVDDSVYDLIVAVIKEKCNYYKIINYKDEDYVSYSCSDSSYKGKIGFMIKEGEGWIRHFPPNAPTQD